MSTLIIVTAQAVELRKKGLIGRIGGIENLFVVFNNGDKKETFKDLTRISSKFFSEEEVETCLKFDLCLRAGKISTYGKYEPTFSIKEAKTLIEKPYNGRTAKKFKAKILKNMDSGNTVDIRTINGYFCYGSENTIILEKDFKRL